MIVSLGGGMRPAEGFLVSYCCCPQTQSKPSDLIWSFISSEQNVPVLFSYRSRSPVHSRLIRQNLSQLASQLWWISLCQSTMQLVPNSLTLIATVAYMTLHDVTADDVNCCCCCCCCGNCWEDDSKLTDWLRGVDLFAIYPRDFHEINSKKRRWRPTAQ